MRHFLLSAIFAAGLLAPVSTVHAQTTARFADCVRLVRARAKV
jgi:hypothetical protein